MAYDTPEQFRRGPPLLSLLHQSACSEIALNVRSLAGEWFSFEPRVVRTRVYFVERPGNRAGLDASTRSRFTVSHGGAYAAPLRDVITSARAKSCPPMVRPTGLARWRIIEHMFEVTSETLHRMSSTRNACQINSPRAAVYRALLDAHAIETWRVPTGMSSHVHEWLELASTEQLPQLPPRVARVQALSHNPRFLR